jgi:putative Holliday junction resolvase
VVGLPYNTDGSESAAAAAARGFGAELGRRYGLPIEFVDERYSSLEGGARLREARSAGLRKRRIAKSDLDAAAACVILERWISDAT